MRQESLFQEIYKPLSVAGVNEDEAKDKCDEENLRLAPPYPDPYNVEQKSSPLKLYQHGGSDIQSIDGHQVVFFNPLLPLQNFAREPVASLIVAEDLLSVNDFSLQKLWEQQDFIKREIEKSSFSCKASVRACVCVCVCVCV